MELEIPSITLDGIDVSVGSRAFRTQKENQQLDLWNLHISALCSTADFQILGLGWREYHVVHQLD